METVILKNFLIETKSIDGVDNWSCRGLWMLWCRRKILQMGLLKLIEEREPETHDEEEEAYGLLLCPLFDFFQVLNNLKI